MVVRLLKRLQWLGLIGSSHEKAEVVQGRRRCFYFYAPTGTAIANLDRFNRAGPACPLPPRLGFQRLCWIEDL